MVLCHDRGTEDKQQKIMDTKADKIQSPERKSYILQAMPAFSKLLL
jgi:hypothetical protein